MERSSDKVERNTSAVFQEAIVREQKTKAGQFTLALLYERLTLLPKIKLNSHTEDKGRFRPKFPKEQN